MPSSFKRALFGEPGESKKQKADLFNQDPQVMYVCHYYENVLGPVPEVGVMAKRPQWLLNVGTLSARMAVLRSCALDI
jgi:hypothetical protein